MVIIGRVSKQRINLKCRRTLLFSLVSPVVHQHPCKCIPLLTHNPKEGRREKLKSQVPASLTLLDFDPAPLQHAEQRAIGRANHIDSDVLPPERRAVLRSHASCH